MNDFPTSSANIPIANVQMDDGGNMKDIDQYK